VDRRGMPDRSDFSDQDMEASTDRWMGWGILLLVLFVAAFPAYRAGEPTRRAQALAEYQTGLASQGQNLYKESCSQCHGIDGSGGMGPALNSQQFLLAVDNRQIADLIATGSPGTLMAPYAADFGGSLTSAQIGSIVTYLRSQEEDAPDVPEWRTPLAQEGLTGREMFVMGCAYCHGPNLEGTENAPDLGPGSDASEESDSRLARRIAEGEDDMPAFGSVLVEDQIMLLVGYIREAQGGG